MKKCTKCNTEKQLFDFGKRHDKINTICKSCTNKRQVEYNHKNGINKRRFNQPKNDLTGMKSGKLTVIKDVGTKNKVRYWLCKCDCGEFKEFKHSHLNRKMVKSCGCEQYHQGSKHYQWRGCGEISGNRWDSIKRKRRHAKEREFDLTIEQSWDLFLKQDRKCALSGIKLEFGKTNKDPFTASLDRIDSNKGYTIDNVQWLHKHVNWMKNTFSQEYFIEMCNKIALNSTNSKLI